MARFDARRALRPALREISEYRPIDPPEQAAARYGVAAEAVVKLDGNENPYGPSPRARAALGGEYAVHRYPDPDQRRMRAALAGHLGVAADCIVAGAGSDELIDLVFRTYIEPGQRVVIASPTFGMYAFDAALHGVEIVDVPRRSEGWAIDGDALVEAAAGAQAVLLASPNNPTGCALPAGLVDKLLDSGALTVVDEAYVEFSDQPSLAPIAASGAPLIVLRTFSKWAGLAGLRAGYAVMPRELASQFMRVKQPYSVSVAAEVAALASLEDAALLDERACAIAAERDRMADGLRASGWIEPAPSDANFLLCRLLRSDGATAQEGLRRRGVFVRYFDDERLRRHVRVSVGTAADTDRLLEAIDDVGRELEGSP